MLVLHEDPLGREFGWESHTGPDLAAHSMERSPGGWLIEADLSVTLSTTLRQPTVEPGHLGHLCSPSSLPRQVPFWLPPCPF